MFDFGKILSKTCLHKYFRGVYRDFASEIIGEYLDLNQFNIYIFIKDSSYFALVISQSECYIIDPLFRDVKTYLQPILDDWCDSTDVVYLPGRRVQNIESNSQLCKVTSGSYVLFYLLEICHHKPKKPEFTQNLALNDSKVRRWFSQFKQSKHD